MLFSSKCPLPALVAWCRVLKHSIGAGLDLKRIFRQQAKSGPRALRSVAGEILGRIEKGDSLEDALEPHRNRFPPLFIEMIAVGEQTGRLEDTFRELEAYYETTLRVQREFRSQMTYPVIQFVGAVLVLAGMTFVLGLLDLKIDPLGLGLSGAAGAVTILVVAFGFAGGIFFLFKLANDSVRWRSTFEGLGLMVPVWGGALLNFALHRFCIALRMTTEAGLRAEQVLKYSFRATANSVFQRGEAVAIGVAKKGGEIHEGLAASRAPFPEEFLESIEVAEVTGNMSEVAERMAENYREEGSRRLKMAAEFTGYAIYAGVGIGIIVLIFKMAGTYFGAINNAAGGMR